MKFWQYTVSSHLLYLSLIILIYYLKITRSVKFFINSFTTKYKTKIKVNRNKKPYAREYTSNCHSYLGLFKYCLHVEIKPANMGLDSCTTIIIFYV